METHRRQARSQVASRVRSEMRESKIAAGLAGRSIHDWHDLGEAHADRANRSVRLWQQVRRAVSVLSTASILACSTSTFEPPEGCRFNSDAATQLADTFLGQLGVNWGDPVRISFDGVDYRLVYETPQGEDQRALLVSCITGAVVLS